MTNQTHTADVRIADNRIASWRSEYEASRFDATLQAINETKREQISQAAILDHFHRLMDQQDRAVAFLRDENRQLREEIVKLADRLDAFGQRIKERLSELETK